MPIAGPSEYSAHAVLNHVLRNTAFTSPTTVYIALFVTDDPEGGIEIAGGAYARQSVTFGAPSNKLVTNTNLVSFPSPTADWGEPRSFAIMDASTGGNILAKGPLDEVFSIRSGDGGPSFAIGSIVVLFE